MSSLLKRYARENPPPNEQQNGTVSQMEAEDIIPDMPVLDDTPPRDTFPLSEHQLIELAKKVYDAKNGVNDPSLLADNFR